MSESPQVQNTRPPRQISRSEKPLATSTLHIDPTPKATSDQDESWSSTGESDEPSPEFNATKSASQTPPSDTVASESQRNVNTSDIVPIMPPPKFIPKSKKESASKPDISQVERQRTPSPKRFIHISPPNDIPTLSDRDSESDLADHILDSMAATSPSPKKQRHTLSLAERTRLSMSRASHSQYSDLQDDCDDLADLPRLAIRPKPAHRTSSSAPSEEEKHADLIERTRKSMAGFEVAQKKAQLERRRSLKDARKKQRESTYFPSVEEEVAVTPSINKQELMEGDPDYESVFKSRPKIKTSPAVSPMRSFVEESNDELGD